MCLALTITVIVQSMTFNTQLSLSIPDQSKSYLTYESNTLGFNIDYPQNWAYYENMDVDRVVSFFDNSSNTSFLTRPQIDVKVTENTETINKYTLEQLQNTITAGLKYIFPTMQTIESNIITIPTSGYKAINQTYVIEDKDNFNDTIKGINYFIKFENRSYTINFNAKQEDFQKYWQIFNTMINSFKVVDIKSNLPTIDTSFKENIKKLLRQGSKEQYGLEIPFFMIKTDSMEPLLKKNGLVTVSAKIPFDQLVLGDIIAFKSPSNTSETIISRIVNITNSPTDEKILTTKGDANQLPIEGLDYPIKKENYVGKVILINK